MMFLISVACVILGMYIAFMLSRTVANLLIVGMAILGVLVISWGRSNDIVMGFFGTVLSSVIVGGVAGLLCLPALPFSSWYKYIEKLQREMDKPGSGDAPRDHSSQGTDGAGVRTVHDGKN